MIFYVLATCGCFASDLLLTLTWCLKYCFNAMFDFLTMHIFRSFHKFLKSSNPNFPVMSACLNVSQGEQQHRQFNANVLLTTYSRPTTEHVVHYNRL